MEGAMYRYVRFAAVFAAICLLLVPVVSATGTVPTKDGTAGSDARVLTAISGAELNDILDEAGYSGGKVDQDGDVFLKIEDRSVYFLIATNKDSIQAKAAWRTNDTSRPSTEKMNTWNRTKRYSKTYFDKDRDPVLQLDLDLAGGITVARLKDFALTVRASVRAFATEVLQ
jgi:hypothetical protein